MGSYGQPIVNTGQFYGGPRPPRRPPLVSDYAGYQNTSNPREMFQNERARSSAWGDIAEQEYRDTGPEYYGQEDRYRTAGDEAYRDILEGRGGYDPQTAQNIIREDELQNLRMSPEEFNNQFLMGDEQRNIQGDPYAATRVLNPAEMQGRIDEGTGRQRALMGEGAGNIRGVTGGPGLAAERGNVMGAIDPRRLSVSGEFRDQYPMTQADIAALSEMATKVAQRPYAGAYRDVERTAAASGTAAPGALMAYGGRVARDSSIAGSDAATRARLAADAERRNQLAELERMRLESERDISGRRVGAEFDLAGDARARAGLIAGTESDLLSQGINVEQNAVAAGQRAGEFQQGTMAGLTADAEQQQAGRARDVALNRQESERYGGQQRYQRGMETTGALRTGYQDTAQARRQDEQEARSYLPGQQREAGQRQAEAQDARIRSRQVSGNQSLAAAGGPEQGSFVRREVLPWFSGAHGTIAEHPQAMIVGENEPEAVIPMSKMGQVMTAVDTALGPRRNPVFDMRRYGDEYRAEPMGETEEMPGKPKQMRRYGGGGGGAVGNIAKMAMMFAGGGG